jgi:DNA-binding NarL/FixJ family response regulator
MVAEENAVIRAGLRNMIEQDERLRVVGEAPDVERLPGQVRSRHPDVVMLSTGLAGRDLGGLIEAIRKASPATSVLAIAAPRDSSDGLIEAGASGVIHLGLGAEAIAQSVISVVSGSQFVIARDDEQPAAAPGGALTPRELSILALIAAGDTNAQIGESLFISSKTVERQVATIVRKLGARNRAHATAVAVSRGLVRAPEPPSH